MHILFKIFILFLLVNNSFSKEEVSLKKIELIIEEYLLNNPEIIIKSLENYRSSQEAKIQEQLKLYVKIIMTKKSMILIYRKC